jgi:hypothetical protein
MKRTNKKRGPSYKFKSSTLSEQAHRAAERYDHTKKFWALKKRPFIRLADTFAWRNRYQMMEQASQAFVAIETGVPQDVGPTISDWKKCSDKASVVIRRLCALSISTRASFTISDLEARLPRAYASRRTVQNIINRGEELGLIEKESTDVYSVTEAFITEFSDRNLVRLLDPDIVAWARQIVMFDDMIKIANTTVKNEQMGTLFDSNLRTMSERIDSGDYDSEIKYERPHKDDK